MLCVNRWPMLCCVTHLRFCLMQHVVADYQEALSVAEACLKQLKLLHHLNVYRLACTCM